MAMASPPPFAAAMPVAPAARPGARPATPVATLLPAHPPALPHPPPRAPKPNTVVTARIDPAPAPRQVFAPVLPAYVPTTVAVHAPTIQNASATAPSPYPSYVGSALGTSRTSPAAAGPGVYRARRVQPGLRDQPGLRRQPMNEPPPADAPPPPSLRRGIPRMGAVPRMENVRVTTPDLLRRNALEKTRGRLLLTAAGFMVLFGAVVAKLTTASILFPMMPKLQAEVVKLPDPFATGDAAADGDAPAPAAHHPARQHHRPQRHLARRVAAHRRALRQPQGDDRPGGRGP